MTERCPICFASGDLMCSACMNVSYCSANHQREHWKIHENLCCPFKLKDDPDLGQHWIATRNLKSGSILWEEISAYSSPVFSGFNSNSTDESDNSTCVTCGLRITAVKKFVCSTCSWPVCGADCEHNGLHSENECKVFSTDGVLSPPANISPTEIMYCILLIRASGLRKFRPDKYKELLDITDTIPKLVNTEPYDEDTFQLAKLLSTIPSLQRESAEDQTKLLRFFKVKGIMTQIYGEYITPPPVSTVMCLFPQASYLSHSCAPNCTWAISPFPECKIRIRTAVPVKAGVPLTITYFIKDHSYGTYFRQKNILRRTGKVCKCPRCLDPTELGTYMSAMTCRSCRDSYLAIGHENDSHSGYLLPKDTLDTGEFAVWQCNQCDGITLSSKLIPEVESIYERMKVKEKDLLENESEQTRHLDRFYSGLIQQFQRFTLHPNHWILQEAARGILKYHARLFQTNSSDLDIEQLDQCICYCEYLLAIENDISPGMSLNRASIQRRLSQAILLKLLNCTEPTDMYMELEQCRQLQSEVYSFYENRLPITSDVTPLLVQDIMVEMYAAGCPDQNIGERSLKFQLQKAACINYLNNFSVSNFLNCRPNVSSNVN